MENTTNKTQSKQTHQNNIKQTPTTKCNQQKPQSKQPTSNNQHKAQYPQNK